MKKFFISLVAVLIIFGQAAQVHAQFTDSLDKLNQAVGPKTKTGLQGDIAPVISTVISGVLGILGTIFFVLMVYAGVKWMIARGDEGEVEKAKEIIKTAVIGLVVTLAAYAITYFIGTRLTSSTSSGSSTATEILGCCFKADHSVCSANNKQADCAAGVSWQEGACPTGCP